jgi:hypothetical protein
MTAPTHTGEPLPAPSPAASIKPSAPAPGNDGVGGLIISPDGALLSLSPDGGFLLVDVGN